MGDGDTGDEAQIHMLKESGFKIQGDLVDLTHVADTEGCQNGEDGKERSQDGADGLAVLVLAQTILQVVHSTAGPFAVHIAATEVDTQNVFGEIGHHTEESSEPHPEHSARAADDDGGRNTCDIAGADGSCQCSAQSLELGDGLFVGFLGCIAAAHKKGTDGGAPPVL